jgi:hypothetical protein
MTTIVRDRVFQGPSGSYNGGTAYRNAIVTTSDNTATVIFSSPVVAVGESLVIKALIVGRKSDATAAAGIEKVAVFRRQSAGNITLVGSVQGTTQTDGVTPAITIAVNTTAQTAEVKVTGITAETWLWEAHVVYHKV